MHEQSGCLGDQNGRGQNRASFRLLRAQYFSGSGDDLSQLSENLDIDTFFILRPLSCLEKQELQWRLQNKM